MPPARLPIVALAGFAAALLVLAAPAVAGPRTGKIYDCYIYNVGTGLTYVQALELKTRTSYLVAPYRRANHLRGKAARGRYHASGNRITFKTGPYAHKYKGVYHPKKTGERARIELFERNDDHTGISCYMH